VPDIDIAYLHQFPYLVGDDDRSFPGLLVQVRNPGAEEAGVEVQAHLDSGAEYSLFTGWIAATLGLELLIGEAVTFSSTGGARIEARRHNVVVSHEGLGDFPLTLAFSLGDIQRNLLGRDFFAAIQIGFREEHRELYITPSP
jgi:hypothetical protein